MPQRKFVATQILVFDLELFIGVRFTAVPQTLLQDLPTCPPPDKMVVRMKKITTISVLLLIALCPDAQAHSKIERIWLTYRANTPSSIVVSWETETPENSTVRYRAGNDPEQRISVDGNATLHHVEIPIDKKDVVYHYSVHSGSMSSLVHTFKGLPTSEFRVAVAANWQRRPALDAILKDDIHLLLTAGDNINNTWQQGGAGTKECTTPYSDLIDAYPALFRSVPFMPVLGNHDKEFRPRGSTPPDTPVYDIEATAFRKFFELPDEEWKWHFDVPEFDIRFIALDLNHISDMGTTWQACHPFHRGSSQYEWYMSLMGSPKQRFIVTLYNEKNSSVRRQEDSSWQKMLENGTVCISGFGYFAEKAVRGDFVYYNTSLSGTGDKYPDPNSVLLLSEHNYILMTLEAKPSRMVVEMKDLTGKTLDKSVYLSVDSIVYKPKQLSNDGSKKWKTQ
jgi:hypothetical protein